MPASARRLVLLACLLLAAPLARAGDAPDGAAPLPTDPRVVQGRLDNGMAWWIRPHRMPQGKVVLLLHVGSGSLQESEDQRGLAHFLEHMAFNGSEHFPPGEMVKLFESMGMRFGQHQNAFTSFDQTSYVLSLPDTKPGTLDKALLFLADVADRLLILPQEVEKERGVILEEERARSGLQQRLMQELLPRLLPGSRLAERIPIGLHDVILGAPPERLRAYYETWYRPDRTTLIVVGDVDPAALAPRIAEAFGAWKAPDTPAPAVDLGIRLPDGWRADVVTDPEETEAGVSILRVRRQPPRETVGDLRADLAEDLAMRMLDRRLARLVQEGKAAYESASVGAGMDLAGWELVMASATGRPERWAESHAQLVRELRRAREHGFSAEETARARAGLLAELEQAAETEEGRDAQAVLMGLNRTLAAGRRPLAARTRADLAARLLPTIEPAEAQAALRAALDPAEGLVLVTLPDGTGVTADAVKAAHEQALAAPVEAGATAAAVAGLTGEDPEPVAVVAREHDDALGATSLTFANGAVVHVRPLPAVDEVTIAVRVFGGIVEEDASTRGLTEAGAVAFAPDRAATKDLAPADVSEFLSSRKVSVGGAADGISVMLTVRGVPTDLADGLRLARRLLTAPRVDAASLASWKQEAKNNLKALPTNAMMQALVGEQRALSGDDLRLRPLTDARVDAITPEAAQAWLERILREGPIEAVITGGISMEDAEALAGRWIGTLPARPDRRADLRALRTVKEAPGPFLEDVEVPSLAPLAVVLLGWRGVPIEDRAGRIALHQAGLILSSRLIDVVREERGLTYSIGSGYSGTDFEHLDALLVQFTADPRKAAEAADVAKGVVLDLLEHPPTEAEVQAAERQLANILEAQVQDPAFWVSALGGLRANDRTLAQASAHLARLRTVDVAAVVEVARRILEDDRYVRVIAGPRVPAPAGAGD